MLYIGSEVAVPWSGLASVTESPEGGGAQPYYLDGRKILNIPVGEDFAGSIEAFGAPKEFAPCAGRLRLSTGLYVADQPKEVFDFSYRTLIGNDSAGPSFGYKVHVVYNAMAKIADYTHSTDVDTPSIKTYSWDITTFPESPAGYRPTSHFIFDTRFVNAYIVARLEDILYGDDDNDPRMPTADELVTLLTNPPIGVWYDLTGLADFPTGALAGDMGVDFSNGDLYADEAPDDVAFWWDLTGDLDFPDGASIGDWGYDTVTGQVWKCIPAGSVDLPKMGLSGTGTVT
jgi:hypothetical protein